MTVENSKPRIDIKKFALWMSEVTNNSKCPFCQNEYWSAINGASFVGCALPFGDGKGDMYMTGTPVLPLVCKTCNFVRNVALTPELLERVLEEEPSDTQ